MHIKIFNSQMEKYYVSGYYIQIDQNILQVLI